MTRLTWTQRGSKERRGDSGGKSGCRGLGRRQERSFFSAERKILSSRENETAEGEEKGTTEIHVAEGRGNGQREIDTAEGERKWEKGNTSRRKRKWTNGKRNKDSKRENK